MGNPAFSQELTVVDLVRCLCCGARYTKPSGAGTARSNPGCPGCSYLGWIALRPDSEPLHSAADQRRRRCA